MNSSRFHLPVAVWLFAGCFLIFCMVVIGGITRLTGSGLSITEWNLIMGTFPPSDTQEWEEAFAKYQQIPQFTEVNNHFTLDDFKAIFWWEYIHRLVGRLIGLVFVIPFVYFLIRGWLDSEMKKKAFFLFLLGGLQGFLGWFMVKSGLAERTSVSHIRLAIHLTTAFITFGFTFWFALQYTDRRSIAPASSVLKNRLRWLLPLLILQLVYGAFVAGLHAGLIHNTFPLMDGSFVPQNLWVKGFGLRNLSDNPSAVQFIHRLLAYSVAIFILIIRFSSSKFSLSNRQMSALNLLLGAVAMQFILGVLTVLYHAPLSLASIHQIGAFFLFSSLLWTYFCFRETSTVKS